MRASLDLSGEWYGERRNSRMSSDVISQWSTSPSSGKRRTGQGIVLMDRNGGGEGASGEGDEEVFNPLALFPSV